MSHPSVFLVSLAFLLATAVHGDSAKEGNVNEQLMSACAMGDVEEVASLLHQGADVNYAGAEGETPLHLSSIHGAMDVAKLLIEKNADVNKRASGTASLAMAPLHWFMFMRGCTEGVRMLIGAGARVNDICWTEQGDFITPLDIADKLGDQRTEEKAMLIDAGAKRYSDMDDSERSKHAPPPNSGPSASKEE